MHHRIAEGGMDAARVLTLATNFGSCALVPIAIALAFDIFVASTQITTKANGIVVAAAFLLVAMIFWFGVEFLTRRKRTIMPDSKTKAPPLEAQVDQLLTEARVIIPGAQALLGFQLTATLTNAFAELPSAVKYAHLAALCGVGLAVILLMAPASLHRIAYGGEDDPQFVRIASWLVIGAPLPLALGIALDTFVAADRAVHSTSYAGVMAAGAIILLLGTWYAYPVAQRLWQSGATE